MFKIAFAAFLALLVSACSGGGSTDATPTSKPADTATVSATQTLAPEPTASPAATPTTTPLATGAPGYYPTWTRTGITQIDTVLDAIFAADAAKLTELFELTPSPCVVNPQGIHNPPACPDGVAAGTLLPVFRAMAGEAVWPDGLNQVVSNWLARPHGLYSVYREPPASHSGWIPAADFAIVLADLKQTSEPWFASEVRITGGRVTSITFGGSAGAAELVAGIAPGQFVLPPLAK